jgi:hypothetical protein
MNVSASGHTYVVPERFPKAVKLIRRALSESELSVVGEFEAMRLCSGEQGEKWEPFRILLVDCPFLSFEAQALDRAAGVFFPLHVYVGADGDRTQTFLASSSDLFDNRLPLGVSGPMAKLLDRVSIALESVLVRAEQRDDQ